MTTTQPQPDIAPDVLADKLAPLAQRYTTLADQKARLDEELEEVKAAIRDIIDTGTVDLPDGHKIAVTPNARFDEKKALGLIPEQLAALVTYPETRVNKDLLKGLAPDVYAQAQTVYTPRVSVK